MRWFFIIFAFLLVAVFFGIRKRGTKFTRPPFELFNDMDRQYKVKYQKPSEFFADGMGSRKPVEGTIPLGFQFPISKKDGIVQTDLDFSVGDGYYATGYIGTNYGKGFPTELTVDSDLLQRGKQRYQINCSPCHGDSGNGQGTVSKFWGVVPTQEEGQKDKAFLEDLSAHNGIPSTANLLDQRVIDMPEGQVYHTIVHGKGLMGPYGGWINNKDRWAIVAYVKALQAASK